MKHLALIHRNIVIALTICFLGCSEQESAASQDSFFHNQSAEEVGFDNNFLFELSQEAGTLSNIYSFLVVKDRSLVHEAYFNGATPESLLHVRSITKSISSMLIGISLGAEEIPDEDEKVSFYFEDYIATDRGDMIDQVSLAHILDMQTGFEWNEQSESLNWYTSLSDTWGYFFEKKVSTAPGSTFNYNSGAVSLLTRFIEQNQSLSYLDYADQHLFRPLGIESYSWEKDGLANTRADAGLQLRASDLCKIGYVMMHDGMIEGTEVVTDKWVEESWQFVHDLGSDYGPIKNLHYNNLWWMGVYNGKEIFFGLGYGGQLLFCVPDHDLIVVTNHEFRLPPNQVASHSINFIENVFIPIMDHLE